MLPQNNRTATDLDRAGEEAKAAGRCAAVLCCILLAPLGGEKLAAQKPATTVNGNLIPRDMGDIPDATIEYQQFDKKPLKFTARAHYILVPVIVTDKDGKHVSGLTKDAFQILENGKEQTDCQRGRDPDKRRSGTSVPASVDEFSNAITVDGGARRINVIALDLINTPFLDQVGARKAAIRYLANSINQDAIFELVSIDGNGMHVLHDFTSDTKVLIAALKHVASKLDAMTGTDTGTIRQATASPGLETRNGIAVTYQAHGVSCYRPGEHGARSIRPRRRPNRPLRTSGSCGQHFRSFPANCASVVGHPGT